MSGGLDSRFNRVLPPLDADPRGPVGAPLIDGVGRSRVIDMGFPNGRKQPLNMTYHERTIKTITIPLAIFPSRLLLAMAALFAFA